MDISSNLGIAAKNSEDEGVWECVRCGNCCRAGFEIVIHKEDVKRWIEAKRTDIAKHMKIDPKCIAPEGLAGYHIEEVNAIELLKEKYEGEEYKKKIQELIDFIKKNHQYEGVDIVPLPIYTILPDMEKRPILVPKNFLAVRDGWKWGLTYVMKYDSPGQCFFQEKNNCSIHEIKPVDCQAFPHDGDGSLKIDDFRLKVCKGFQKK